jgi:hypothetical protein
MRGVKKKDRLVLIQVVKQVNDDHDDGGGHGDDQVLKAWKRREKQNGLKTKVYLIGPFCVGDQDT